MLDAMFWSLWVDIFRCVYLKFLSDRFHDTNWPLYMVSIRVTSSLAYHHGMSVVLAQKESPSRESLLHRVTHPLNGTEDGEQGLAWKEDLRMKITEQRQQPR
jgi:hypothetical protein